MKSVVKPVVNDSENADAEPDAEADEGDMETTVVSEDEA
jgi:hypothetical protein